MDVEQNLASLTEVLSELSEMRGIPRNVKTVIDEAIKAMKNAKESSSARVNMAVTLLDEISNDPNIPGHLRTQVWNVVSMLEALKGQLE